MVQIIAGRKGKGKTKYLLEKANEAVEKAHGSIVYLDKNGKHMYELNNKIRLINVREYPIDSTEAFIGFIIGIISQDHDLEEMFLDSFLNLAELEGRDVSRALHQLKEIGEKYSVIFVLSVSLDKVSLPAEFQDDVVISL